MLLLIWHQTIQSFLDLSFSYFLDHSAINDLMQYRLDRLLCPWLTQISGADSTSIIPRGAKICITLYMPIKMGWKGNNDRSSDYYLIMLVLPGSECILLITRLNIISYHGIHGRNPTLILTSQHDQNLLVTVINKYYILHPVIIVFISMMYVSTFQRFSTKRRMSTGIKPKTCAYLKVLPAQTKLHCTIT